MTFRIAVLSVVSAVTTLGLSTGTADARPFCYETGPGYQKCIDSPSGDYFNPIYQGPKIYEGGNVPWVPTYNPPVAPALPPAPSVNAVDVLAGTALNNIQNALDADPANAQFNIRVLQVSLTQTGSTSFEGVATMTAGGGPPHDIPVHVFDDNGTLTWKIDPGVMAVLVQ